MNLTTDTVLFFLGFVGGTMLALMYFEYQTARNAAQDKKRRRK